MFGFKFWEIAATLGVPGFALAIFAYLFRGFVFKIPRKWQGPLALAFMVIVGGVVYFAIDRFGPQPPSGEYLVRVTVLDPNSNPLDEAEVVSSLGGERKRVEGGWEFVIPKSAVPSNGMLTIRAAQRTRGLSGTETIALGDDRSVAVTVTTAQDTSAEIAGTVRDEHNNGIADARVTHANGEAVTDPDGRFQLAANAPQGTEIRLHATSEGYMPSDQYAVAGDDDVVIILRKQTP